jgi:hypothetical protein
VPRPLRNERVGLSLATVVIIALPLAIGWQAASRPQGPTTEPAFILVVGAWLVGLVIGLATVAYQAWRGRLIVRDPRQVMRNQVGNRTIGAVMLPLSVGLVLLLSGARIAGLNVLPLLVMVICGFMLPLMVVVLYITFRLRPDELNSPDPAVADAAARRLRGDS